MQRKIWMLLIALTVVCFVGCEKEEGTGGTGKISGTLVVKTYDKDFRILQDESPAVDEDVFIVFGDENVVGDKTSTNFNGNFEFSFLRQGDYTIFYSSEDSLSPIGNDKESMLKVTLSKGKNLDLGDLVQYKSIDYDDGASVIKGRVLQINYWKQSVYPHLITRDTTVAQELEVYLTFGDDNFYSERIRTQDDGSFAFNNLIKGDYRVFLYSEDVSGGEAKVVVDSNTLIAEHGQVVDLGDLFIEEH